MEKNQNSITQEETNQQVVDQNRLGGVSEVTSTSSEEENQYDIERIERKSRRLRNRVSMNQIPSIRCSDIELDNFQKILQNNQIWAEDMIKNDSDFFKRMKDIQKPQYLWIGCSDSRVPANQIVGLRPGELFVHRNVANQAPLSDINALACIQFSVEVLKVKDIIVCGHYGCGGVRACFKKHDHGSLQGWLSYIRDLRARYRKQFIGQTAQQNQNLLVQLNVKQQVNNISRIPIVQKMWKQGNQLRIHGVVYQLQNGILKDLQITIDSLESLQQEYRIY